MPGVSILPSSPGLASPSQNGFPRAQDDLSVADIKERARESVAKQARGASAFTLFKTGRNLYATANDLESRGDLRGALSAITKTASLMAMTMASSEFQAESKGKGGLLRKEFTEFFESAGLLERTKGIEEKLAEFEKANPRSNDIQQDQGPVTKSGGSIADRMRALQDNGLAISAPKRLSIQAPNPISVSPIRPTPLAPLLPTQSQSPATPVSQSPSPHSFVSPSTLGPPSPSSSPPSSPQASNISLSEFRNNFPSIDELDESPPFTLPSVPTGVGPSIPSLKDPLASFRNFTVPPERPSSTPIPPTLNTFGSRPVSPSSKPPTIPHKPSGLSSSVAPKTPISKSNAVFPHELHTYLKEHNLLLVDVRNRDAFDREHIRADAVICMEPQVLWRANVSPEMLEDSFIGPKESTLFNNRDKFDLVVFYDDDSTRVSNDGPVAILLSAIFEKAFKKPLKRMPMILVGGLQAWKKEIGDAEIVRGPSSVGEPSTRVATLPQPTPTTNGVVSPKPSSNNPFANGAYASLVSAPQTDQHQVWSPNRIRSDSTPFNNEPPTLSHRASFSLDQTPSHSRSPAEAGYSSIAGPSVLVRRPALSRAPFSTTTSTMIPENSTSPPPSASGIVYPSFPPRMSPSISVPSSFTPSSQWDITSPPAASIKPAMARKHGDYVDQSQQAVSSIRPPIDYPELSTQHILRPPPAVASGALERQDQRVRQQPFSPTGGFPGAPGAPTQPRIASDYPVTFWADVQIGTSGLKNMGNTCYMNAPIQCLSASVPFSRFFTDGRWRSAINYTNTMGSKGRLTGSFAQLVHSMWGGDLPYLTPIDFRKTICQLKAQYVGSDQHDSQEFLSFLLDGIHEDLNRIISKPVWAPTPEQEAELERLPPQIAGDQEWRAWKMRNDSIIVDYFQGQFRSRLECLTCHKTSTTYNVFSILQLPIPPSRSGKVPLQKCLDALFNTETLEKDNAWDCPQCKVKRKATKQLSLARLPPILLIHLKRFEANGRFSDKIDTFVDYPMKTLDLTGFMPPPLPPGADKGPDNVPMSPDDPRSQMPPYKYDLYGVTNHIGNLSSGHYTAFVASRGGWLYCDDSSVKSVDPKQVVGQRAYVLFYKRTKA